MTDVKIRCDDCKFVENCVDYGWDGCKKFTPKPSEPMTTWEEIRDEVAGMLADGKPLEDVIAKLEQRKNEMAKAELIAVFDELKKPKPMTNEEYLRSANVNDMARCIATKLLELARREYGIYDVCDYATIFEWLKEKHNG